MKRLHVNLSVGDLAQSVDFYTALFDAEPSVRKPDYAKWMLDDPRVNFAIVARGQQTGVQHLGIQAESEGELAELLARLSAADAPVRDDGQVTCCYARSEKSWARDPQGIAWEAFRTMGDSDVFGDGAPSKGQSRAAPCCG